MSSRETSLNFDRLPSVMYDIPMVLTGGGGKGIVIQF